MTEKAGFSGWQLITTFLLFVSSGHGQITPDDTVVPDRFEFVSGEYVVTEDATNAVIAVRFYPGNRSYSGSVHYETRDGTATANEDYVPVSGMLSFSGVSYKSFTVPIIMDSVDEDEQTVQLILRGGWNTLITGGYAVLKIANVRPGPKLQIVAGRDGILTISWPDDGINRVLEKSALPAGPDWAAVSVTPTNVNSRFFVTEAMSGMAGFYRLRKLP